MRLSRSIPIVTGLAAALLFPAAAAAQAPGIGFGIAAGQNIPTADYADAAQAGLVLNGFLELRTGSPLAVRGSLFWSRSDMDNPLIRDRDGVTLPEGVDYDVRGDVDLIGASADVTLGATDGVIRPYVVGGVGAFRRRVSQDIDGAVAEFRSLRESETDIGFNGGVGLRIALGGLAVFAEARYYSVSTKPDRTNFVPVTVGVAF
ncbi:MAG TPA: outer membrane beta-barrel protein [Gemmatimonadales bacterium]